MTPSLHRVLGRWVGVPGGLVAFLPIVGIVAVMTIPSCGGGGDALVATPAASFNLLTPVDTTITPLPPAPETGFHLVYQEFGATEDKIWRISPQDPTNREEVATIQHREGWSVKPSLSPDSRMLAYIAVPEGFTDASYQGELFMIDLRRQETELVYRGVDQRFRPLWTPDGEYLYARRLFGEETFILQVKVTRKLAPGDTPTPSPSPTPSTTPTPFVEETPFVETPFVEETPLPEGETPFVEETPFFEETPSPSPTPTPAPEDAVKAILKAHQGSVLTFIPAGFADDGKSMYLIQVQGGTGGGTLVVSYAPATTLAIAEEKARPTPPPQPPDAPPTPLPTPPQAAFIVKLSDQIARDYDLSPDKKHLTYLSQEIVEGQFVLRAFTADLAARVTAPLPADGLPPSDHFRPLWHPDGTRLAVGLLPTGVETGAVALVPAGGGAPGFLPAPERGFDVPVAWAPDGSFLAVTSYSGDSLANLGTPRTDLVSPTGHRVVVADGPQFEVVGWFAPPPSPTPTP